MSRSGYSDSDSCEEYDDLRVYGWNANVQRMLKGKTGQAFLWTLYQALTDLPQQELITGVLMDSSGCVCALGAVAAARGIEIPGEFRAVYGPSSYCGSHYVATLQEDYDSDAQSDGGTHEAMAAIFDIKGMMVQEIMYQNDDCGVERYVDSDLSIYGGPGTYRPMAPRREETDRERWLRMRQWVAGKLTSIP